MSVSEHNDKYFTVPIDSIHTEGLGFDLYIIHDRGNAVLYRSSGTSYSITDCVQLQAQGVTHFYVPVEQHRRFQDALCGRMSQAFGNDGLARDERVRVVRESCCKLIEEFMHHPAFPGMSETLTSVAGMFSDWCNQNEAEFGFLLEMSAHDFATTTHMVNVGIGCTLLGAELIGPDHELVRELALGGLIHDIGKREIPAELLAKEGKLLGHEWGLLRQHPVRGGRLLHERQGLSKIAVDMALNHHERPDGKGYPNGIKGELISLPARICAVVNVYDSLSTARAHRGPISPRAALGLMRREADKAFDAKILAGWERVVERMLSDPSRAAPEGGDASGLMLDAMMPSPLAQSRPECGYMVIRCGGGMTYECEMVAHTLSEIVLQGRAELKVGDVVTLCPQDGREAQCVFSSTRIGSRGQRLMVFKMGGERVAA